MYRRPARAQKRATLSRSRGVLPVLAVAAWIFVPPRPCAADSTVVFNEIMYHPPGNELELEWVELYNQMAVDMDISGWAMTAGIRFEFPEGTVVKGGAFVVLSIAPDALEAATGYAGAYGPFEGRLENSGENLELRNNNGRLMDRIRYGQGGDWPIEPDGSGVSLAKLDPDTASGPARNWARSLEIGGTPGEPNFPSPEDEAKPPAGLISCWTFDDSPIGAVEYLEDFEEPDGPPEDWMIHQPEAAISSGRLRLRSGPGGEPLAWAGIGTVPMSFGGIRSVSFRAEFVGLPGDGAGRRGGVVFCASEPAHRWAEGLSGYSVDWAGDNGYEVTRISSGTHEPLAAGSAHADPGSEWRIELDDGRFTLTVDGEEIGSYADPSYRSGYVGLWCGENAGQEVLFDDVRIIYTRATADTADGNDGMPGPGTASVDGIIGKGAVSLDNTPEAFVDIGAGTGNNFSTTTGITIEAIITPGWSAAFRDSDAIFDKGDPDRRILFGFQNDDVAWNRDVFIFPLQQPVLSFGLNVGGTYSELDMPLDGAEGRPSPGDLEDGQAHHVAATYDSSSGVKAIYIDGSLRMSVEMAPGSRISSGGDAGATIGNSLERGEAFTGTIDEVAFWARALSPQEISEHFQSFQTGEGYLPRPDGGPGSSQLAFNETFISATEEPWVEIVNVGARAVHLEDHVIASGDTPAAQFVFPTMEIPPEGYIHLLQSEIGFPLVPGDRLFLYTPARSSVLAAVRLEAALRGRHPDGIGRWLFPDQATPGAANRFTFYEDIVINEIMYHAMGDPEDQGEYVEIFNRGDLAVDLAGFAFTAGILYTFPAGAIIPPGGYIIVARDPDRIRAEYGIQAVHGPYQGVLANRGERIALSDPFGNPVDEVHYHDRGRWPEYADGGGSSLELRDPWADNSKAEAWAASDESRRSEWKAYSYRGIAAGNIGPTVWNEFVLGILDAGEALVDDIHVIESPAGAQVEFLQNGTFETGADHWRILGNHGQSAVIVDPDDPANHVLHLVATGPTEHMHNHAETTFAGGRRVRNGTEYEISFRARWLGGSNQFHTRLYFNRLPRTTLLAVPEARGTPGAPNSRGEENIGPTFSDFGHEPVVPAPNEVVTVSVVAEDPQGVASSTLWWSVQGGPWDSSPMTPRGEGRYLGSIPGQGTARIVQVFVEAEDFRGASSTFPPRGPDSRALYKTRDGQAVLGKVHNLRIILTPEDTNFLHLVTNLMSNERLPATVVYDEKEVFYDVGVRLRGSERGRVTDERIGFNLYFQPDQLFRGVHPSVGIDRSGGWRFGRTFGQDEILIKHIVNHAGGIPGMYDDIIRVIAPRSTHTGSALLLMARFNDVFLDSQWENGSDGTSFTFELIYYPTSTVDGHPESLKRPSPDQVTGTDILDLGNDKEVYRWNFIIENNRDRDDYSGMIALCKAFSLPAASLEAGTEQVMDVDEWMRTFAMYSLCGVGDTYTQGLDHNNIYYVRPTDGRVIVFPWDMDFSFTRSASSPLWGDRNLARIIALPPNTRRFYGHLQDIIDTTFNTTYMSRWVSHYGSLCGQNMGSVTSYISQRASYVMGRLPTQVPFSIITQNGSDFSTESDRTAIVGQAPIEVTTLALNGSIIEPRWTAATRWTFTVNLDPGPNRLEFQGFDRYGEDAGSAVITVTSTLGWKTPQVFFVSPTRGPETGGTEVRMEGLDFQAGLVVRFGGIDAPNVQYLSDSSILATSPPGKGVVPIEVENPCGLKSEAPARFIYFPVTVTFRRGDANGDGRIGLGDTIRILRRVFGSADVQCLDALDVDNDGGLGMDDAVLLLGFTFGRGPQPAPPFEECGTDGEGDGLGCDEFPACR